jgi:hypothetical protein
MDWIPAISSTALLAILGFAVSVPYRRTIEAAITARFDKKLEEVKSEFRREEDQLKAELRERAAEIEALRSGALSSLAARHAEMGRRRILAVERIWAQVTEMTNLKFLSKFSEGIRMDELLKEADKGGPERNKLSDFAGNILRATNSEAIKSNDNPANNERPFVPEITWALYSAYSKLLILPLLQFTAIKFGAPSKILAGPENMSKILKQALPHQSKFIDDYGGSGFPFLVDELEQTLLRSLRHALEQNDSDEAAVAQARRIMQAVREASQEEQPALAKVDIPPELRQPAPQVRGS